MYNWIVYLTHYKSTITSIKYIYILIKKEAANTYLVWSKGDNMVLDSSCILLIVRLHAHIPTGI